MEGCSLVGNFISAIMNENLSQQIQSLIRQGKRYLTLQINYGKLTLAEKLTILLSGVLLVMICLTLSAFAIGFLAFALVDALKESMSSVGAYSVVAAIFVVLTVVVYFCRKALIINPIARFISKLFFDKKL